MRNPNKYIRKAVVDLLSQATGLQVYDNSIPLDVVGGTSYVLVNSQSKRPTSQSKTCFDWSCSFNIDIHSLNEKGFNSTVKADDIEETVLTAMQNIMVDTWFVKEREFIDSVSMVVELPDYTDNRNTIVYNLWLSRENS